MTSAAINDTGRLLEAALAYAREGLPVFPCRPDNKRPWTRHGFKEASTDESVIRSWWSAHPDAMIGIPTGQASGCWVLDVDDPDLFEANCPVPLPETRKCETGKGQHLWFRHDPETPVRNAQIAMVDGERSWPFSSMPGAEVRGEGGYVIVPPSRHPTGRLYRWLSHAKPVPAPAGLMSIVQRPDRVKKAKERQPLNVLAKAIRGADTSYGLAALEAECSAVRSACDGAQEATLNAAALKIGALVAGGELSSGTARSSLIAAGMAMVSHEPSDPWTADTIAAKVDRGMSDGASEPRCAPKLVSEDGERIDPDTGEVLEEIGVYRTLDPGSWQGLAPEPRRWALNEWIPHGQMTLLTGAGSSGKSLLSQQLATCIAAGIPFLGVETRKAVALYATCEDDSHELHRRQASICQMVEVELADLSGKLHLLPLAGALNNELAIFDDKGRLMPTLAWERLKRTIRAIGARFVVVDNTAHLFAGNENTRNEVAAFVNLLNGLAAEIDGAVLMLGHPNKAGDAYSGSTAWENQVRSRLFLERPKESDGTIADPDARTLSRAKANYAKHGEALSFR
ncbi:hypothetical protein GCM10011371_18350 [Novosphingobium marinum]|uniref:Archaellum biogenesis ATPase FlaH n=1 Tax=Novosphingobium marinum TaxID=1514948 RepID=A0A7Z0BW71_9SPHN|nr:bifunctional DNA primase/polymerase [Novosphingobium marinum]NYH95947.1 archaellum biogenesis ATPase FlaH [Novosphingobium marinum]GGC31250.1 hypothetical protein GCM10011371_18350 [Novosphingobium marinum]